MARRWLVVLVLAAALAAGSWLILKTNLFYPSWGSAEALERARDFSGALEAWEAILRAGPAHAEARLRAARVARRLGNHSLANQYLRMATAAGADGAAVARERLLLAVEEGGIDAIRSGLGIADREMGQPDTPLLLEALVKGALKARQLDGAIAALDRYQSLPVSEADRVQSLIWRGEAIRMMGDLRGASALFAEALERDPASAAAKLRLAESLCEDDPARSRKLVEEVLASNENIPARLVLARACRRLGDLEGCENALAPLGPGVELAQLERGALALERADLEGASRWLERLPDAIKNSPEAVGMRLRLARAKGDNATAETLEKDLLRLEREHAAARDALGPRK